MLFFSYSPFSACFFFLCFFVFALFLLAGLPIPFSAKTRLE